MLCEICKIREANIQFTEIVNGKKTEHCYCMNCAKEMMIGTPQLEIRGDLPIAKILSSLLAQTAAAQEQENIAQITCPTCGTTYEDFIKSSKFGCPDCYEVFGLLIGENIKNLQGSDTHKGKRPRNISDSLTENIREDIDETIENGNENEASLEKLLELKRQLGEAVAAEEYEKAALLRDEINGLESGGKAADE